MHPLPMHPLPMHPLPMHPLQIPRLTHPRTLRRTLLLNETEMTNLCMLLYVSRHQNKNFT